MKKLNIFLLILFVLSFIFCTYKVLNFYKEDKNEEDLKKELVDIVNIPDILSEEPEFKIDFDELRKINPDVVGWIVIEGTQVNYPVVRGNNNSYYLNHSYDKKWSGYGSIFMDCNSSLDFSDFNTFVYGHSTKNGTMFGELYKFMDVNFFNDHPKFYLYTPSANYLVEIFSAYVDDTESDSYNQIFSSWEKYKDYLDTIISKSKYQTNISVDYSSDRIITLYSCSKEANHSKRDRYFIHGKLTKI